MASLFFADDKIKQEEASRPSSSDLRSIKSTEEKANGGFVQPPASSIPEDEQDTPLDESELELKPSRSLTAGETTFAGDVILDAQVTAVASSHPYQDQPTDDDANSTASADSSTVVVAAVDVDIQETTAESTTPTCPKDGAAVPTTTAETSSGYSWASWLVFW